jgi:hypothetical protein
VYVCMYVRMYVCIHIYNGFSGLVVSMLASGTQDREKNPQLPSFGRKVKPFAP